MNAGNILEQFKRLDAKDIGNWPIIPKGVVLSIVFIAVIVLGWWADWNGQIDEKDRLATEETRLRDDYINKKKQTVNLDLYKQQLREIDQSFGALLKQLPNKSQMDALLTEINQAGLGRGLQFELFKPGTETVREFYAELPISIKVVGSYHDIGTFASDISQLARIVTLNDLNITIGKDGTLSMDAIAKTFRYLDDDEMAKQRKTTKESQIKK